MNRTRRCVPLLTLVAALGAGASPPGPLSVRATGPAPAVIPQEHEAAIANAVRLMGEGRYGEAVAGLDRVLEKQPASWEAHYQRGRALGLDGQMDRALPSLLRAVELHPGFAHGHELAAIAARDVGDAELAWAQLVRAFHNGAEVQGLIQRWAAVAPPPADALELLAAPRVVVAPLDLQDITARAELPFNRNPLAREDPSRSGVPDAIRGPDTAQEASADLERVHRQFRAALDRSDQWGVVLDPALSEYVLRIAVDELDQDPPRDMVGYLEIVATATGETGYRRRFELKHLAARGELRAQIELVVNDLENWLLSLSGG